MLLSKNQVFDKKYTFQYNLFMNYFTIISSLVKYIFITTIYVFIFAIIRMIFKDIHKEARREEFVATQSAPILRVITKSGRGNNEARNDYALDKMKIVGGRSANCDIQIGDLMVSKKHFCIWFEDDEWRIRDLNSRNGTFLNGQRVDEPYLLDDGDRIRVGEMELEFRV